MAGGEDGGKPLIAVLVASVAQLRRAGAERRPGSPLAQQDAAP